MRHLPFTCLLLCIGMLACAKPMTPEGGPKDDTLPQLLRSYPIHESTNFTGQAIRLVFDKEIRVQDLLQRLVVTPSLQSPKGKPSYTYKVRGNRLIMKLACPLEKDTTYTFNFNDAIKDTTEGNVAEAPAITFSTGSQLDTLHISGQVKCLMTAQPQKGARVAVYRLLETPEGELPEVAAAPQNGEGDDQTIAKADLDAVPLFSSLPDYLTVTDEEGLFRLTHIKPGRYRIYASYNQEKQPNQWRHVDPSKDLYGFLAMPLDLTESIEDLTIAIVQADVSSFVLRSRQVQGPCFEFTFSKPVKQYTLNFAQQLKRLQGQRLYSHLVESDRTIRVYNTLGLLEEDYLEACLEATDAMGNRIEETVELRFKARRPSKEGLQCQVKPKSGASIRPTGQGHIHCSQPIQQLLLDKCYWTIGRGEDGQPLQAEQVQFNTHRDELTFHWQWGQLASEEALSGDNQEAYRVTLHLEEGALIAADGRKNKALKSHYTLQDPKAYGSIQGQVTTQAPGFIIQLLSPTYEVLQEIRHMPSYAFQALAPGHYRLRLLLLQSTEADWQFGDIRTNQMPDPVIVYPEEVSVIANWQVEDIDFSD